MKVSRMWLQEYITAPLPPAEAIADALTFHAFEIESIEQTEDDAILDIKITPNRGHDCLSHRGIARELAAILSLPLTQKTLSQFDTQGSAVDVRVADARLCPRFTGLHIRGVHVTPSPAWLKKRLEALGQRSINTIVDATNLVMLGEGQPLHAFDVKKIQGSSLRAELSVESLQSKESFLALDDKTYELPEGTLVIRNAEKVLSIAGIKGGKESGVDETTNEIFLEAASWHGPTIRKTSQILKLRTDASQRFEQQMSPECTLRGLLEAAELIGTLSGGEVVGGLDVYPAPQRACAMRVTEKATSGILGISVSLERMSDALTRLGFSHTKEADALLVEIPHERIDLLPPEGGEEDLVEEIARIIGYDEVGARELPPLAGLPAQDSAYGALEATREALLRDGYSEVYTSVFSETGERAVANNIGGEKPFLRTTLRNGLEEAYERNLHLKDLLGIKEVKLFEIGTIWKGGKEHLSAALIDARGYNEKELFSSTALSEEMPTSKLERYQPFSRYPFIVRDVAFWTPSDTEAKGAVEAVRAAAPMLAQRINLFDTFKKGERISYAVRIVFQSFERTLTDEEANTAMNDIYAALTSRGWEIR
jgi:phenylalanyl-tRNA synthetase beta chain